MNGSILKLDSSPKQHNLTKVGIWREYYILHLSHKNMCTFRFRPSHINMSVSIYYPPIHQVIYNLYHHQNTNNNVGPTIHQHYFNYPSPPLSYFANFGLIPVPYHMPIFLWNEGSNILKCAFLRRKFIINWE